MLIFYNKTTANRSNSNLLKISGFCFLLGLITPVIAAYVSLQGYRIHEDQFQPNCVIGITAFIFYGYLTTFFGMPALYLCFFQIRKNE